MSLLRQNLLAVALFVTWSTTSASGNNRIFNFKFGNPGGPEVFLQPVNSGAPDVEDSVDLGFSKENHNKAAFLSYGYDDFDLFGVNVAVPPKKPSKIALYDTLQKTFSDINYGPPPPMDSYGVPSVPAGPYGGAQRRSGDFEPPVTNFKTNDPTKNKFGALFSGIQDGFQEWTEGMKAFFKLDEKKAPGRLFPKYGANQLALVGAGTGPVYAGGYGHAQPPAPYQVPPYLQGPPPSPYAAPPQPYQAIPLQVAPAAYTIAPILVTDSHAMPPVTNGPYRAAVGGDEASPAGEAPKITAARKASRGHKAKGSFLRTLDQPVSHKQPEVGSPQPIFQGTLQQPYPILRQQQRYGQQSQTYQQASPSVQVNQQGYAPAFQVVPAGSVSRPTQVTYELEGAASDLQPSFAARPSQETQYQTTSRTESTIATHPSPASEDPSPESSTSGVDPGQVGQQSSSSRIRTSSSSHSGPSYSDSDEWLDEEVHDLTSSQRGQGQLDKDVVDGGSSEDSKRPQINEQSKDELGDDVLGQLPVATSSRSIVRNDEFEELRPVYVPKS